MVRSSTVNTIPTPSEQVAAPALSATPTVLVVEDEENLLFTLRYNLEREGYRVLTAARGDDGLRTAREFSPDLVVLDLMLPGMDGIQLCRQLRRNSQVPVIMLTALGGESDKVAGLDIGADDYLAKPFEMSELFARLRVMERRLTTARTAEITINGVTLDINHNSVVVGGEAMEFSRREFMLLKSLMENAGRVQTRNTLESRLYSWGEEVSSNALEVHIHHLRRKLGADFIKTVRGVGYKVESP
jgi:DNA-binding response OmpR family regulator